MQFKELSANGLNRQYEVVVEAKVVAEQIDKKLADIAKTAKIPGFRQGKVPAQVLKKRYGDSATAETIEQLTQNSSRDLMKEKDIRPAMTPKVSEFKYNEGEDLKFTLTVDLFPEIPELDFAKIKIERPLSEVKDSDVEGAMERLRARFRDLKVVEKPRAAKKGDVLTINFVGKIDGKEFEGGAADGFKVEIGAGQMIPGFEDELIGLKPNDEKSFEVTFPDDYGVEHLEGKKATFDVKLIDISDVILPELNAEFAEKLRFESVEELRKSVKEQVENDYNEMSRAIVKRRLFDELEKTLEFEIPQSMLQLEFDSIWENLKKAQANGDPTLIGRSDDDLKEEYTKVALRRVRLGLFLSEVGRKNDIKVTNDELRDAIFNQAKRYPGQVQKIFEFYNQNPEYLEDIRAPLYEDKTVDFIREKISYDDKKVDSESLEDIYFEESSGRKDKKEKKEKSSSGKTAKSKKSEQ